MDNCSQTFRSNTVFKLTKYKSASSKEVNRKRLLSPTAFSGFKYKIPFGYNLTHKKPSSSYNVRCCSRMSDLTNSTEYKYCTPQLKYKPQFKCAAITSYINPVVVLPQKQINYNINYEFEYRKQISLFSDKPMKTLSIEGFLHEHPFISPKYNARSIQTLDALQNKFVTQWRVAKPTKISLRTRVLKIISKLQQLNICITDIQSGIVFSTKPLQKQYAKEFIDACRQGDSILAKICLIKNKFLVYDFDYTGKTALHWATIRGNYTIMELLLQHHADIDAKDLLRRTPLHYAAMHNDITSIKILLSCNADPFIHCSLGMEARELASTHDIKILFKKVRKLQVIIRWVPFKNQKSFLLAALREVNDTGYATSLYNAHLSS